MYFHCIVMLYNIIESYSEIKGGNEHKRNSFPLCIIFLFTIHRTSQQQCQCTELNEIIQTENFTTNKMRIRNLYDVITFDYLFCVYVRDTLKCLYRYLCLFHPDIFYYITKKEENDVEGGCVCRKFQ